MRDPIFSGRIIKGSERGPDKVPEGDLEGASDRGPEGGPERGLRQPLVVRMPERTYQLQHP